MTRLMSNQDPLLTDMAHAPGWFAMLPQPAPAERLTGHHVADWVVVGAGVTGLAAARRLAELAPQARIILLDEYRVGYGASGRNSGFIIDTPHLTEEFDVDANQRVSRLVIAGLAELDTHVREQEIECEWSPVGHLTAVVQSKRAKKLRSTCSTLDAVNEGYEWLEGDALADIVGTHHYHAAVYTPRSVLLNPAALCRGLGDSLPDNVDIYEETRVLRVEPGKPVRIECSGGSISAANVLLTTNAFIEKLGFLRNRVFPLIECASLSRELTLDEQAMIGGAPDWGITGYATVRRTQSNRILVRHGTYHTSNFCLRGDFRKQVIKNQKEGLLKRFPMLDKLEFEYSWAGVFCMTRNWASVFGRLEPGIFASLGYAGIGMPRGTISGKLLAEYALGLESDLIRDVLALSDPKLLPPQPFLGYGVNARLAWERWCARGEW